MTSNPVPEFPKHFDYKKREQEIYALWLKEKAFETAYTQEGKLRDPKKKNARPFVVVIPPPNITGRLHMGHALNNTIQDVLIRYKRMDGYDALWVPGTDHAGIATQTVVKKHLDAEGKDFREIGRDAVIERIWAWRNKYGNTILEQLKRMGCSCDWSRTRFTMDEGLNRAVRHAFVKLYEDGLIYRGQRIVNWCPVDQTALSDDEVDKADEKGKMYHLRYPLSEDSSQYLVVATTRPETMFGDVAVAVHPEDPRYKTWIGKTLRLPLQGRLIPVIGDEHANPEMGTGCVKITPAHDPNDFEVGLRHKLEMINVMNPDATMNEVVPEEFRGLDRYKCRQRVLEKLEAEGLVEGIFDHTLAIGRSYRSRVPIEFRLSYQWFVRMKPLADKALQASGWTEQRNQDQEISWVRNIDKSNLTITPERHEKVYLHWLSQIRDWCISRQIWWGHRIPAWFNQESGEIIVSMDEPEIVKKSPTLWKQDEDVLDTWFSSWLWPMSVLGWPDKTPDFERYYPTSVLSTAKDILFFWVARMNFAGLYFENNLPYKQVYIHSTIQDDKGQTMSKSKGNGIDPMTPIEGASLEALKRPVEEARPSDMKELIRRLEKNYPNGFEAVGADAMRWTLIYSVNEGEHLKLSLTRFTEGRNFITKLWNASGRIIQALRNEEHNPKQRAFALELSSHKVSFSDTDAWILTRISSTVKISRDYLNRFDFGALAQELYHFVWDDFASWALELSKPRLQSTDPTVRRIALSAMGNMLMDLFRTLHPIIPFVTEELWSQLTPEMERLELFLNSDRPNSILALDQFPSGNPPSHISKENNIEERFSILQRFVNAVRNLRATSNVKDNIKITVEVKPLHPDAKKMIEAQKSAVCFLGKMENIEFVESKKKGTAARYDSAFEVYLDLGKYIDLKVEVERLKKEKERTDKEISTLGALLASDDFKARAPAEKVEESQNRLAEAREKNQKLQVTIEEFENLT